MLLKIDTADERKHNLGITFIFFAKHNEIVCLVFLMLLLLLQTLASQVKGPSSDALEESCRMEAAARERGSEWEDVLGSGKLMKRVVRDGRGGERPTDGYWVTIKVSITAFE